MIHNIKKRKGRFTSEEKIMEKLKETLRVQVRRMWVQKQKRKRKNKDKKN